MAGAAAGGVAVARPPPRSAFLSLDDVIPRGDTDRFQPIPANHPDLFSDASLKRPMAYRAYDSALGRQVMAHEMRPISQPLVIPRYFSAYEMDQFKNEQDKLIKEASKSDHEILPNDLQWHRLSAETWNDLTVHDQWRGMVADYESAKTNAAYYSRTVLNGSAHRTIPIFGDRGGPNDLHYIVWVFSQRASIHKHLLSTLINIILAAWATINDRWLRYAPKRAFSEAMPPFVVFFYPHDFKLVDKPTDNFTVYTDLLAMARHCTAVDYVYRILGLVHTLHPDLRLETAKRKKADASAAAVTEDGDGEDGSSSLWDWISKYLFKQWVLHFATCRWERVPTNPTLAASFNILQLSTYGESQNDQKYIHAKTRKWFVIRKASYYQAKLSYPKEEVNRTAAFGAPVFFTHLLANPAMPIFSAPGRLNRSDRLMTFAWTHSGWSGRESTEALRVLVRAILRSDDTLVVDDDSKRSGDGSPPVKRTRLALVVGSRAGGGGAAGEKRSSDSKNRCYTKMPHLAPSVSPPRARYTFCVDAEPNKKVYIALTPPRSLSEPVVFTLRFIPDFDERSVAYWSPQYIRWCLAYGADLLRVHDDHEDDANRLARMHYPVGIVGGAPPSGASEPVPFLGTRFVVYTRVTAPDGSASDMPLERRYWIGHALRHGESATTGTAVYDRMRAISCVGKQEKDIIRTVLAYHHYVDDHERLAMFQATIASECTLEEQRITAHFFESVHPMAAEIRKNVLQRLEAWDRRSPFVLKDEPGLGLIDAETALASMKKVGYVKGTLPDSSVALAGLLARIRIQAYVGARFDRSVVMPPRLEKLDLAVDDDSGVIYQWMEWCQKEWLTVYEKVWYPTLRFIRMRAVTPAIECTNALGRAVSWHDLTPRVSPLQRIATDCFAPLTLLLAGDDGSIARFIREEARPDLPTMQFLHSLLLLTQESKLHSDITTAIRAAMGRYNHASGTDDNHSRTWMMCRLMISQCLTIHPCMFNAEVLRACHQMLATDPEFVYEPGTMGKLTAPSDRIAEILTNLAVDAKHSLVYATGIKRSLAGASAHGDYQTWPCHVILRSIHAIPQLRSLIGSGDLPALLPPPPPAMAVAVARPLPPLVHLRSPAAAPPPAPRPITVTIARAVHATPVVATLADESIF